MKKLEKYRDENMELFPDKLKFIIPFLPHFRTVRLLM